MEYRRERPISPTKTNVSRRQFTVTSILSAVGLTSVGDLFARRAEAMDCKNYERLGLHEPFWAGTVNGRSNREILDALSVAEDAQYNPCAEAHPAQETPRGVRRYGRRL